MTHCSGGPRRAAIVIFEREQHAMLARLPTTDSVSAPSRHIDASLVTRAISGDQEAVNQLLAEHQRFVYQVAMRLLQDHHAAEDVVQEVLLLTWRALPRLRAEYALRAWLRRVTRNVVISQLRRHRHESVALSVELLDPNEGPGVAAEQGEFHAELEQAFASLSGGQRQILALRFQANLSYEEIARLAQRPLGTVKSTVARGCERLRRTLLAESVDSHCSYTPSSRSPHGPEPSTGK